MRCCGTTALPPETAMRALLQIALLMLTLPSYGASITDKLLAGLYAQPAASAVPLRALPSGTPLEILEQRDGFSRVRLGDRSEGWVEQRYITDQKSARVMLLELQAKHGAVKARLREVEHQLAQRQPERTATASTAAAGQVTANPLPAPAAPTWQPWHLPLIALSMLLSFMAGIAYRNYRMVRQKRF